MQLDLVLSKRGPEFGLDVRENFLVADRSDNGVAVEGPRHELHVVSRAREAGADLVPRQELVDVEDFRGVHARRGAQLEVRGVAVR